MHPAYSVSLGQRTQQTFPRIPLHCPKKAFQIADKTQSFVQRKHSQSQTRPSPLPKESSPNHQQVTPLCSKKTPRSAAKPHSLCPKKLYQQSARSASLPQAIFLSVKAKPLETGKAGGLSYLGWVCHRLIALLPHPVRRNPSAKATDRESKRIYLVPKRSDCELMRAASSK